MHFERLLKRVNRAFVISRGDPRLALHQIRVFVLVQLAFRWRETAGDKRHASYRKRKPAEPGEQHFQQANGFTSDAQSLPVPAMPWGAQNRVPDWLRML